MSRARTAIINQSLLLFKRPKTAPKKANHGMKPRNDQAQFPAWNRRNIRQRNKARQGGFTIVEVALSLIVFAMMAMMFGAVFPMAVRGAQYSSNYAQATLVAQHKLDQLRSAGYKRATTASGLLALNIIDSTTANADGSYNFAATDNLVSTGTVKGFFPVGSTGTVTISDYTGSGVPSGTVAYVTVKIKWVGGGVSNGSYTLSTMISSAALP